MAGTRGTKLGKVLIENRIQELYAKGRKGRTLLETLELGNLLYWTSLRMMFLGEDWDWGKP